MFFLYFSERVGFDQALTLGAVYYIAVVVLEVPSGYFSDRVGRRPTLLIASAGMLLASLGFLLADSWWPLVGCQALLAAGIAFQSGSDSALLHDSLAALDRRDEYAAAEARARTVSMIALSASCLAGGALGSMDLELPYVLAAIAACSALLIVSRMTEPPPEVETPGALCSAPGSALSRGLADPVLRWLLIWYVLAFTLAHVPYEFTQPWIRLLGDTDVGAWIAKGDRTPMTSGVIAALSMFGGALGAMVSMRVAIRLGLPTLLLLSNAIQVVIIAGLALALHPLVLMLILGRSIAMSLTHAPLMAAIAPRVRSVHRATWLSIQSLAGRLGFSMVLWVLAGQVNASLDWTSLQGVLIVTGVVGGALAGAVWWLAPGEIRRSVTVSPDSRA